MSRPDPSSVAPVPRWVETLAAPGTATARAAELVRKAGEPELPGEERMAAIRSRIVLRRGPRRARRRFTPALVVAALLVGATLGAAAREWIAPLLGPARARPEVEEAPPPSHAPARKRRLATRTPATPVTPPPPEEAPVSPGDTAEGPAVAPAPAAPVAPPVRPARRATATVAAPSVPGVSEEAGLLGTAIRRLRREHDARGALAALDDRAGRFPAGTLGDEADLVRVEALLALGDRAAALRLLDGKDLAAGPRAREALELRGELRAAAGRCGEAIGDLERAIGASSSRPANDALAERGLYARASCLSRLHRYPEARRELEAYLRRFPSGAHAAAATAALGQLPAGD